MEGFVRVEAWSYTPPPPPRDHAVLAYALRHGAVTAPQVAVAAPEGEPLFTSLWSCERRLRALRAAGLMRRWPAAWDHGPDVFTVTAAGARLVPQVRLQAPERPDLGTLRHDLCVVDLSEQLLADNPGSRWRSERELRRDQLLRHRAAGMAMLAERRRSPDGALVLAAGEVVAVELDLTPKRSSTYRILLNAYVAMANAGARTRRRRPPGRSPRPARRRARRRRASAHHGRAAPRCRLPRR